MFQKAGRPRGGLAIHWQMEAIVITQELHRGRLIDHIHLVVANLDASRRFYEAILEVLGIPVGGGAPDYFWADELFVSTVKSPVAPGQLTGRHHLAFQAKDRAMVERSTKWGLGRAAKTTADPANVPTIPATTLRSFSTPAATTSKRYIMARRIVAHLP